MEPNTPAETQQPWPAFCEYRSTLLDPFAPVNSCLFQEKREAGRLYAEPASQPRMFWNILCHQNACVWPHVPFERAFNLLKRKKLAPALYAAQNGKHFEPPAKGGHKSAMMLRAKRAQCAARPKPFEGQCRKANHAMPARQLRTPANRHAISLRMVAQSRAFRFA